MIQKIQSFDTPAAIWLALGISLVAHAVALPFSENCDADALSRIYGGIYWLESPTLITEGIWAPFHKYFCALSIAIIPDQVWGPKILHAIMGVLLVIPVIKFSKSYVSIIPSILLGLAISLSPILFRNSFHALSGVPFAFFVAYAMYWVDHAVRDKENWKAALYAGLMMTIAAGFRYEGWLFMALLLIPFLVAWKPKALIIYSAAAGIFPLFWMIGNFVAHDDIFYFLEGSKFWNLTAEGANDWMAPGELTMRKLFFSYSTALILSPWLFLTSIVATLVAVLRKKVNRVFLAWLIIFPVMLVVFSVKATNGTLFTQHRFTQLLILAFIPWLVVTMQTIDRKWFQITFLVNIGLAFWLSFQWGNYKIENVFSGELKQGLYNARDWSSNQMWGVPRLKERFPAEVSAYLGENLTSDQTLIMDFLGWEATSFISLRSELRVSEYYLVPGGANQKPDLQSISELIQSRNSKSGYVVTSDKGKLISNNSSGVLQLNEAHSLALRLKQDFGGAQVYFWEMK